MRLFSTKRGNFQELVLGPLFPLIIVFAVFLILLSYTSAVSQSSYFEREFVTKDIGLMIEVMQASPNNVNINYPNNPKLKDLKVTINKNFIQANTYNIDPVLAPSKTSKFLLYPSFMNVNEFTAAPRVEKDQNGKDITFSYSLYFTKNSNGITTSSTQRNVQVENDENSFKNLINTAIANWYQTPLVYIDLLYSQSENSYNISGKEVLTNICNYLEIKGKLGIYSDCKIKTLEERKKQAKDADFIIILYVNENKASKEIIDIYSFGKSNEAETKAQKMAGLSLINLKTTYSDTQSKRIDEPLKSQIQQLTDSKPVIIIEIGNLEKITKTDLDKISEPLFNAIKVYYS